MMKQLLSTVQRLNSIITLRGFLILVFLLYLITGPVQQEDDIVATVLSSSLLSYLAVILAITAINGLRIKNSFSLIMASPDAGTNSESTESTLKSKTPTLFIIRTSPLSILPMFQLQIQVEFENEDLSLPVHKLTGSVRDERLITEEITFPHRGTWIVKRILYSFSDQLGLSRVCWEQGDEKINQQFKVRPPAGAQDTLPILSSCHRAGDSIIDIHERCGDPFDLRQYQPTDGVKKIVWKIYAKAGELISRHPEPSMTPEGQVAIFCLASKDDDDVCSTVVSYIKRLEALQLEVYFGCEGMDRAPLARDAESAENLLIDTVWNAEGTTEQSMVVNIENFTGKVKKDIGDARMERILIFCSSDRVRDEEALRMYIAVGEFLERNKVTPVYCVTVSPGTTAYLQSGAELTDSLSAAPTELIIEKFLQLLIDSDDKNGDAAPRYYPRFMELCMQKQWQVIV